MSARPTGTVTFLFTDVEGSTVRWEEHPDEMRLAMARHDEIMREVMVGHDGAIFTTAGDEFCVAFASPRRALEAALAAQFALDAHEWGAVGPLLVRMAMHTGTADERDGDYFGPPLNRCARLLSLGHGGQVLLSAATAALVRHELPESARLVELGPHRLKDVEDPEEVYQLVHPRLRQDFPRLRSPGPAQDAAAVLADARQAFAAERWRHAFNGFADAGEHIRLEAEDLEAQATSAWWIGRIDESTTLREKAFAAYSRERKVEEAARVALVLSVHFFHEGAPAVTRAWTARAERLLADREGTLAHGYLLRSLTTQAFEMDNDPEAALALAERVIAAGQALENRNLEALGLQDKGRILVAMGRVAEGMRLIDETMVATTGGELDTLTTGISYCNLLGVCAQVADYQRAVEWSKAAEEWCDAQPDATFPGICRIHRAELKQRHGDWAVAAEDLEEAGRELKGYARIRAVAEYQLGEIALRKGDLAEAEARFRNANEHGFPPLPGMARLRLRQGDPEAAGELLAGVMARSSPLMQARFLPTAIDAALAQGRTDAAADLLASLDEVAGMCDSGAMRAEADTRRAALALAQGDTEAAVTHAGAAIDGWLALSMPYEVAQARMLLAQARAAAGSTASAALERDSAIAAFERLGAALDVEEAAALPVG